MSITASPDIRPALGDAYLTCFGRQLPPTLQIVHFSDREVIRYNFHGIAGIKISVPRDSAIARAIVDLQPLQTPQEENREWARPTSAWVSIYHPESFNIYVASGKKPPRNEALEFDVSRVPEGLEVSLKFGFDHRRIPYEVVLAPIYSPRAE